jgi:hypothetical protein
MIVTLQTRFNSPKKIYDTDSPSTGANKSAVGKFFMELFKPYAVIKEGNVTLYEMNKPYPDESAKWQFLIGLGIAAGVIGGTALIFGLGRLSKK